MTQPQDITPEAINEWLKKNNRDRDWLANQLGTSTGTVSNWLAKGKPRPIPEPTIRLIERLMCDDLLEAPQFSLEEAKLIRAAMEQHNYQTYREFVRDAVIGNARRLSQAGLSVYITAPEPDLSNKVAEEETPYRFTPKPHILAAAGSPILADVIDWDGADDTVLVKINGLSMVPLLNDGDVIAMKHRKASRNPYMKKGLIYLVQYDGGYTVKRYNSRPATADESGEEWVEAGRVKVLESINPEFPEIIIKQPMEWIAWLEQA